MAYSGIFITKLDDISTIAIPVEVQKGLVLEPGDKVEVSIKRIRSRRLDINIARNPLSKLLDLAE